MFFWYVAPLVSGLLAIAGITQRLTLPPPILPLNLFLFGSAIFFVCSAKGKHISHHAPLRLLIGLQVFRLPLELLLNRLGEEKAIPIEMTFQGYNYDIITGLLALVFILFPKPRLGWIIQVVGLICLSVILVIVVVALPIPFGLTTTALMLPTYFPFIWLPTLLVLSAVLLHGLSIRALLRGRQEK